MNDLTGDSFPFRDVADVPPVQLVAHACFVAVEGVRRVQSESLHFLAARTARHVAFVERCAACATPPELFGVGCSFALETGEDYFAESMKLFGLAAEQFESSASAMV